MAEYLIQETTLTQIADGVRKVTNTKNQMSPNDMILALNEFGREKGVTDWIDEICFWDYDGTLIQHFPVEEAKNLTELPKLSSHNGLDFQSWNHTLEEIKAATYPLDIGATYITSDRNTHILINITNTSYLTVPLYFHQIVSGGLTINWGDGTIEIIQTNGNIITSHKYAALGTYEIILEVQDNNIVTLGQGSTATSFIGGNTSVYRQYAKEIYIGNNIKFNDYALYSTSSMEILTIPQSYTFLPKAFAQYSGNYKAFILPRGITSLNEYSLAGIGPQPQELTRIISIPQTVVQFSAYTFYTCKAIRLCIPLNITNIPDSCFRQCTSLKRLFWPDSITAIGNYSLWSLNKISQIKLPQSLQTLGTNNFSNSLFIRELILPPNLTSIGANCYTGTALERLIINSETMPTTIPSYLDFAEQIQEIVLTTPLILNKDLLLYGPNYSCFFYVPDEVLEANRALLEDFRKPYIVPLSSYPGILPLN